ESDLPTGDRRGTPGPNAVPGLAGGFVIKMVGSYTNVDGLPLYEAMTLLLGEGYPIHFNWLKGN
ncbi:MAG: septum formation inhibitor Maf, partial [Bauldia litoralis]